MSQTKQKAILLLAFGGADSLENVEPFIKNVISPRTPSHELIEDVRMHYTMIGGRSPLLDITNDVAIDLQELLLTEGYDGSRVYVGMRNWHPFIKETLKEMRDDGIEEAVAVIMSPLQTPVATGAYNKLLAEAVEEIGGGIKVEVADSFEEQFNYYNAVIENMHTALTGFMDIREKMKIRFIYSAHSLPVKALEGDPYVSKVEEIVDALNDKFTIVNSKIAYQSKGGGAGEWLGPTVEEAMEEAKEAGDRGVLIIPIGFVADHVETLYDIDIVFKTKARELGLTFGRAPSLNNCALFVTCLRDTLVPYLKK